jgi:hypothetical protein
MKMNFWNSYLKKVTFFYVFYVISFSLFKFHLLPSISITRRRTRRRAGTISSPSFLQKENTSKTSSDTQDNYFSNAPIYGNIGINHLVEGLLASEAYQQFTPLTYAHPFPYHSIPLQLL